MRGHVSKCWRRVSLEWRQKRCRWCGEQFWVCLARHVIRVTAALRPLGNGGGLQTKRKALPVSPEGRANHPDEWPSSPWASVCRKSASGHRSTHWSSPASRMRNVASVQNGRCHSIGGSNTARSSPTDGGRRASLASEERDRSLGRDADLALELSARIAESLYERLSSSAMRSRTPLTKTLEFSVP